MNTAFITCIISLILTVASPILFVFYAVKKRKAHLRFIDVILGIVACFFGKRVLFSALAKLIGLLPGVSAYAASNAYFEPLLSAVLNTVVTMIAFYGIFRLFYGNSFTRQNGLGIATGAAFIEVLYNLTATLVSNLSYFVMQANGTLESQLSSVYDAATVQTIIQTYESFTPTYYLYFAFLAFMVTANHFLVQVMLRDLAATQRRTTMLYLIGMLMAYSIFYYFASPMTNPAVVVFTLVLAAAQFLFAHYRSTQLDKEYPKTVGVDY